MNHRCTEHPHNRSRWKLVELNRYYCWECIILMLANNDNCQITIEIDQLFGHDKDVSRHLLEGMVD